MRDEDDAPASAGIGEGDLLLWPVEITGGDYVLFGEGFGTPGLRFADAEGQVVHVMLTPEVAQHLFHYLAAFVDANNAQSRH